MPSLKALLQKTMIFTGAPTDFYAAKLGASDPIVPLAPTPTTSGSELDRPIWHWVHNPSFPAEITQLSAIVRGMNNMTMRVCDSIKVERVAITVSRNKGTPVSLPLDPDHVVAKFKLDNGRIPASTTGWWRLESNLDSSMAVVFAYEVIREITKYGGLKDPPKIQKVALADLELDTSFPNAQVTREDPDYIDSSVTPAPAAAGASGPSRTLENTVTAVPARHFVVVVFGLSTCKERPDFEPAGVLGAGRFYPHVMILSSQIMAAAEATIRLERPSAGMMDDEMNGVIAPLLAADANVTRGGPVPLWSNVFDYVVTDPVSKIGLVDAGDVDASGANWMTVVDPTKAARTILGKIKRETATHIPALVEVADFTKTASQGEFDNLHLASGMIYDSLFEPKQTNIKMAPFCVHDCMHTHFRWGNFLEAVMSMEPPNMGFAGRTPYAAEGAPLVPYDQTVKLGLTGSHGFRYQAKAPSRADGCVIPSTWTVFNHHGSAYALGVATGMIANSKWWAPRTLLAASLIAKGEPYTFIPPPPLLPMVTSFDPVTSIAAFYFRLRFTGYSAAGSWVERLQILDLSASTGVRS